jgi:hypothetical protein
MKRWWIVEEPDWRPRPDFRIADDRWTGYHDPVTGTRLPYNAPRQPPAHHHPGAPGGFDSRCPHCIYQRSRTQGDRER